MDSRDGHRECPGCLGRAHLLGNVKNPCPAALDLPHEERARRAGLQAALVSLTDSSSTHGGQSYEPEGKSSGRKHRSSHKPPHKHERRRTADAVDSPELPPSSPVRDSVEENSVCPQLLAAVHGLSDREKSFETHPRQAEASLDHLPSFHEQRHPDAILLYAQGSLLGVGQDQGTLRVGAEVIPPTQGIQHQEVMAQMSPMTRDVGSAMSPAILARRQIWLAQTALPEGVRAELINMPVLPAKVFHPDSQSVLVKAQESDLPPISHSLFSGCIVSGGGVSGGGVSGIVVSGGGVVSGCVVVWFGGCLRRGNRRRAPSYQSPLEQRQALATYAADYVLKVSRSLP
ncbi:unnamed protein product [Arctogadus glacialis]